MQHITTIIVKWMLLVGLNAVMSYFFAVSNNINSISEQIAMILGISTWIVIYICAELYFQHYQLHCWRDSMTISALLKCLTQFYPMIELMTGLLSLSIIGYISDKLSDVFGVTIMFSTAIQIYFATVLDGFLLSLFVGLLMPILYLMLRLYRVNLRI